MATLVEEYQKLADEARKANIQRMKEVGAIHDEIIRRYQPGGQFLKGGKALLEEQKGRETGKAMQQLISSGLYGTTEAAGLGRRWEAEVGAPARFKLEDIAMERLSSAQLGKASFMEGIQQPYPDYSALLQTQQAQGRTTSRSSGPAYTPFGGGIAGRGVGIGGGTVASGGSGYAPGHSPGYWGQTPSTPSTPTAPTPQAPSPPVSEPPTPSPPTPEEEPPKKPAEESPYSDRVIEVNGQKRRLRYSAKHGGWIRVG